MTFGAIFLLAIGLAMDAAAASAARAVAATRVRWRDALLIAALFGGFQALMPAIGWVAGERIGAIAATWDHWIAFVVLAGLGIRMLREARNNAAQPSPPDVDPFAFRVLLLLAVATSIDALAAGVTLPLVDAPLLASVVTIGVTTALLSVAALYAGRAFGALTGPRLDAVGGFLLIVIGTKILVEHLSA